MDRYGNASISNRFNGKKFLNEIIFPIYKIYLFKLSFLNWILIKMAKLILMSLIILLKNYFQLEIGLKAKIIEIIKLFFKIID